MTYFMAPLLLLVAAAGLAVVLTRNPERQVLVAGVYGLLLTILFFAMQSPDVALSQLVIGTIGLPAMLLLALAKLKRGGA